MKVGSFVLSGERGDEALRRRRPAGGYPLNIYAAVTKEEGREGG